MSQTGSPGLRPNYAVASLAGATLDCDLATGAKIGGGTATDNTVLLNSLLACGAANAPAYLLLDGASSCTGLLIPASGHVTIEGLGWDSGVWTASGANKQPISNTVWTPFEGGSAPATQGANVSLRNFKVAGNRGDGLTGNSNSGDPRGTLGVMFYAGIDLANLDHVRLENIWIYDAPLYALRAVNCNDVHIQGCRIEAPSHTFNTDGLHINGPANDIRIDGCYFQTGDDAIALNAPEGLASLGNISRVTITNCVFDNCLSALRIYALGGPGQSYVVKHVVMSNCTGTVIFAPFLLGFNQSGATALDLIQNFTASNCTFHVSQAMNMIQFGNDPVGLVIMDNITWLAPTFPSPWVQFLYANAAISDLQFINSRIYRNVDGNGAAYAIQVSNSSQIKKITFSGFGIEDEAGQSYGAVPYLIDVLSGGLIGQVVINAVDSTNIAGLVNTATVGWAGILQVSGPGVLATGWQIPDSVMANYTPYISATGANAGKPCMKVAGVVKPFSGF